MVKELRNHIGLFNDLTIFTIKGNTIKTHANHSPVIVIANESMEIVHDKKKFTCYGAIIKSNTAHRIKPIDGTSISIYLNPESAIGTGLNLLVKKKKILKIDTAIAKKLFDYFIQNTDQHITESEAKKFIAHYILNVKTIGFEQSLDKRVAEITSYIRSADGSIRFNVLVDLARLSESRLMHLFKQETEITIRKYILWSRTQKATLSILAGSPIKQAARAAGFTDSAHFNRTFVSLYGIAPSLMTKR